MGAQVEGLNAGPDSEAIKEHCLEPSSLSFM